jgi:hypothetical protein
MDSWASMNEVTASRISRTASLLVAASGIIVLLGWATNTELLYKPTANSPVITPWTASCFTALGIAIFGQSWRKFIWGRALMALGGAFVMATMSLMMTEYTVGSLRGVDTLLFPDRVAALSMGHPGRPSLQAALAFLAMAFSTLGTLWEDKRAQHGRWIEGLVFFSSSVALLALFGYAFSVPALFASPELKGGGLSPYSAILFLLSAVALMITEPRSFIGNLLRIRGPGGYIVQWLFPVFIVMPLLFGLLRAEGERRGWISHETGIAFMALGQFFIGTGMLFWVALNLNRVEALKKIIKMSCVSKKILDEGNWVTVEKYLSDHHNIEVSHGMTPEEAETWLREAKESLAVKKT